MIGIELSVSWMDKTICFCSEFPCDIVKLIDRLRKDDPVWLGPITISVVEKETGCFYVK